ncbi:unnamed protein product [Chrysoparadoxa australica]
MSCGWALIPLRDLLQVDDSAKRLKYALQGGTPFSRSDIISDEVSTRRYGWRALLQAMKVEGMNKNSEIEIKVIPCSAMPTSKLENISRLPRNIVVSDSFISLIRFYREYAADALAKHSLNAKGGAGFGVSGAFSEPVLALFPKLIADSAMMSALKHSWELELKKRPSTIEGRMAALYGCVLKMWPAYSHVGAQRRRNGKAESYEALEKRTAKIKSIVSGADGFKSETPTHASSNAKGKDDQLYIAFSAKEVAFTVNG